MTNLLDVVIIGSGPAGYVAAIRASQLGLKVACVEKRSELGGTCLNVGCIPSKTLLQSSEWYWKLLHEGKAHGIEIESIRLHFKQMMARKNKVVLGFNEGINGLFKKNQITRLTGTATFLSSHTLLIQNGSTQKEITAKQIILATGSEPIPLPFLPFDEKRVLSSTGALSLDAVPKKLVVIGSGIIGVELGSVYSRLGSEVRFIEVLDRICPTLDASLSKELQRLLSKQGIQFHLSSRVVGAELSEKKILLRLQEQQIEADAVLICIGRRPFTQGLNLEKVGILPTSKGTIPIDGSFRTAIPHIFAIGDLVDGPMLAHKASEEGVAVAEIIAGHHPVIDYITIPSIVYTHPEVASVGLTEEEIKAQGLSYKVGQFPFKANSRARCYGEEEGFVKILADEKSDRLLGIHIIGPHASELIAEGVIALQQRMTATSLANTPHAHPTLSEALKEAALAVHGRAIHK
jgi:dihydrolipoamide dehydrogenase